MDTMGPLGQARPTMDTMGLLGQDRPIMHTMGPLEQARPTIDTMAMGIFALGQARPTMLWTLWVHWDRLGSLWVYLEG